MMRTPRPNALAAGALLALLLPLPCAALTARDSAALATTFPFDTVLCYGLACFPGPNPPMARPLPVSRYHDTVSFLVNSHPAGCPASSYRDFLLPRLPLFSFRSPLMEMHGDCVRMQCIVRNTAIEYVFAIDSALLFMQVLDADTQSLHVRFDTAWTVSPFEQILGLPVHDSVLAPVFLVAESLGTACPRTAWSEAGPSLPGTVVSPGCAMWECAKSTWPPGLDTVRIHKSPTDSTAPVLTRYVGSDCLDSAVVVRTTGVEYVVPLGDLGTLYAKPLVSANGDTVQFVYDTVSWLNRTATMPRSVAASMDAGPPTIRVQRTPSGLPVLHVDGIPSTEGTVWLRLTDLAGRCVFRGPLGDHATATLALRPGVYSAVLESGARNRCLGTLCVQP